MLVPAVALSFAAQTHAGTVINENWDEYTAGSGVSSPWSQTLGGGTTPAVSQDIVTNTTINSVTSNWLLIDNAATDEVNDNPGLKGTFSAITTTANFSLDYSIPQNYGNGSQIYLTLFSGSKAAIQLVLGKNWQRNGISYYDSTGTNQGVGHTFSAGETVHITLADIDFTLGTYDILWSSSKGTSGSVNDIAFINSVTSLDNLSIGESSPVGGTSKIYLDNISLTTVPEPGTSALLGVSLATLAGATLARRRLAKSQS
jgi:hypothetical protein